MSIFSTKKSWIQLTIWVIIIALIIAAPSLLPVFRLYLLGRYLSLAIVALGVDLIWGFTGMLSLGQGIFFALGGYCVAMFLQLNSAGEFPNGIPEFFGYMESNNFHSFGNHLKVQFLLLFPFGCYRQ